MPSVAFPHGPSVPVLGLGSWHIGEGRRPAAQEAAALQAGLDAGLRLIDTAEMYGDGRSERLIGRAIAGRRDDVFLVSKVYPHHATAEAPLRRALQQSLERLGTDRLDLYLLHWRGNADLRVAVPTFEALRDEGLIGAWGVSNFDVDELEALWRIPGGDRCATNQVLYHPASRGIEYDLLPWCARRGLPVMAYSPLGSAGRSVDGLHEHPVFATIARRHGISPHAAVLAWAVRSGRVIAIPESGDAGHVRANAQALSVTLDAEDLAAVDAAFAPPAGRQPLDVL